MNFDLCKVAKSITNCYFCRNYEHHNICLSIDAFGLTNYMNE